MTQAHSVLTAHQPDSHSPLPRPYTQAEFHRQRLVELDWLRVLVFGLLIFYHTGMLYAEGWGWHYKSTYTSELLTNFMLWSNQWRMSLLFLIGGAAAAYFTLEHGAFRPCCSSHSCSS